MTQNLTERRQLEASLRCASTEPENNSPLKLNAVVMNDSKTPGESADYELKLGVLTTKLHQSDQAESFLAEPNFTLFTASDFPPEDNFCGYDTSLSPPVCKRPFNRYDFLRFFYLRSKSFLCL